MRYTTVFVLLCMVLLLPITASAAGLVPCTGTLSTSTGAYCDFDALVEMVHNIINLIISLSIAISAGMFAFAGVLYFSDGGNKTNIAKAHKIFKNVVIGLVIVLVAWLLVDTILTNLTGNGLDSRAQNPVASPRTP